MLEGDNDYNVDVLIYRVYGRTNMNKLVFKISLY